MRDVFGSDACVEILDIERFAAVLGRHAPLGLSACMGRPVDYFPPEQVTVKDLEDGNNPFIKGPDFEWQKEFRLIWRGCPPGSGGVNVLDQEIPKLVRRVF